MSIAVAIETKDRRLTGHNENYLGRTLANLKRAGLFGSPELHSLHIVSGGEQEDFIEREVLPTIPDLFSSRKVFYHACPEHGSTRHQTAARAIRAASRTNADWVMKLEDDLDFIGDFLGSVARWLADYGKEPVPMFALAATYEFVSKSRFALGERTIFDGDSSFPRVRAKVAAGKRYDTHPVNGFWGAQALVWRQPVAAELAKWLGPDPFLYDGKQEHRHRGHDLLLQHWGNTLRARDFGVAIPSFVQHIGRQSNLDDAATAHVQPFFEFPWAGPFWTYEGGARG